MSGLASILLERNAQVSGSDIASNTMIENLGKLGAKISLGHIPQNVKSGMTVVYSSGIKECNPELQEAKNLNCQMLHRSECLARLMTGYQPLSVTGTHGKTTTTALLGWVLLQAGKDPAFAVGGILPQLQTNARNGGGGYFVAEADESDGSFLQYPSYGAIVTNIGLDHMDHYHSEQELINAFRTFVDKVSCKDLLFWCREDSRLRKIAPGGVSYGFALESQLLGSHFRQEKWNIHFDISFESKVYKDVKIPLIGSHNALNALAVFGLALRLGIPEAEIRNAFSTFCGVSRRCEKKGEEKGVLVIDDYAHHPTEIRTTLNALKQAVSGRRLIAVFQPHRYSRTRDCMGTYGNIFDFADLLFVTDIYGAGEPEIDGVSPLKIVEEIKKASTIPSIYVPKGELINELRKILRANDVVITLGAGDITRLGPQLLSDIRNTTI